MTLDWLEHDYTRHPRLAPVVENLRHYMATELSEYEKTNQLTPESVITRAHLEPVWKRSRELGFYGINLPEQLGGMGLSVSELCILKEEVSSTGNPLFLSVLGDMGGPLRLGSILQHATADQIERYFHPVVSGDRACSFALTEDNAGSDLTELATRAVRDGDHYVITGKKVFSTASPIADFALVIARTDTADAPKAQYSAFLVDFDTPGCTVEPGDVPMAGWHVEGDIVLDHCRIPATNLVGELGQGLAIGLGRITVNRLLWSATLLGVARRSLELSIDFARTRRVGGRPLNELQAIEHMLADMATDIYAARGVIELAAGRADNGGDLRETAAMTKLFVANRAFQVADRAVQIHGKIGLTRGAEVEWNFRLLRMFRVLTGTDEILKNTVAKALK